MRRPAPAAYGAQHDADALAQRAPRMSTQLREISLEYSYAELCAATRSWHASKKVGSGSYGAVFKGELEDGSEVAIKAINLGALGAAGQGPEMAGFDEEVQMLSKFRHPNLVTLLGWGKHELCRYLVYELLAGGDAFQRLQRSKQPGTQLLFLWHERLSVLLDAATGLSHMHNSNPKAFHRDIKSANILLDRHGTAKMADFGLSCTSGRSGALHVTVKTISGTPGYACPLYSRTGRVTEGSEVYSFGMVMLELLTGLAPAAADPSRPGGIAYHVADAVSPGQPGALERCLRALDASASWPPQLAGELGAFGLRCVNALDETQRPRFVEIVRTLRAMGERYPKQAPAPAPPPPAPPAQPQPPPPAAAAAPAAAAPALAAGSGARSGAAVEAAGSAVPSREPTRAAPVVRAAADKATAAPLWLELIRAVGLDVDALPLERRRLPLLPAPGAPPSGPGAAQVGRQHQPDAFEAWLRDEALRGCISRTAFEISWGAGGEGARLVARGANPLSVDGRVVARDSTAALRPGSEVGFTYSSSGELSTFLLLRLEARAAAPAPAAPPAPAAAAARAPAPPAPGELEAARAPAPAQASPARAQAPPASNDLAAARPGAAAQPGGDGPAAGAAGWSLVCVHAEGLSPEALAALPPGVQRFDLPEGTTLVGRQHQAQAFETLLVAAPSRLSFISRTHVQLEARGRSQLSVTNLSTNPLYIDRDPLAKGDTRSLVRNQVLGFARLENGAHVHFLRLRVQEPLDAGAPPVEAPALPPHRVSTSGDAEFAPPKRTAAAPEPAAAARMPSSPAAAGEAAPARPLTEREGVERAKTKAAPASTDPVPARAPAPQGSPARGGQELLPTGPAPAAPEAAALSPERQASSSRLGAPGSVSPLKPQRSSPEPQAQLTPPRAPAGPPTPEPPGRGGASSPSRRRAAEAAPRPLPPPQAARREPAGAGLAEAAPEARGAAPAEVVLELRGEGVLGVPPQQRRIGPVSLADRPLLVGRRHQPELHRRAVTRECLQFLSRDHFRLALEGGELRLLALTSNPIWRDRDHARPVELARGDVIEIQPGDRILLGTGGDSSLAEDARRSLCWHLLRAGDLGEEAPAAPEERGGGRERSGSPRRGRPQGGGGTPPSPGGPGPRVSNAAPWARGVASPGASASPGSSPGGSPAGSGARGGFEPLLPAAEGLAAAGSRAGRRVSELLAADDKRGSASSAALRAPVPLDSLHDRCAAAGEPRGVEFAERRDEFAKSGFRY